MDDTEYEWDEAKRTRNLQKHGVDFQEVYALDWSYALTREDADSFGEARFVTIAPIRGRLHFMSWTDRDGVCRIISLRKTKRFETKLYEESDVW